jgi:hypothetical protein
LGFRGRPSATDVPSLLMRVSTVAYKPSHFSGQVVS